MTVEAIHTRISFWLLHMSHDCNQLSPSDVYLLLRADAEQSWLHREVIPVLEELLAGKLPETQVGAALAYLEVSWLEASRRADETDAAYAELAELDSTPDSTDAKEAHALPDTARHYHLAVRALRNAVAQHVARLLPATNITTSGASLLGAQPSLPRELR